MTAQQRELDFTTPVMRTGEELRDKGMQRAHDHAEDVHESWGDKAYQFLLDHTTEGEFMTEDIRKASEGIIPEPPSLRAWGGIVRRAAKNGIIKRVGYRSVSNNKAHCTPASVWVKI